MIRIKNYIFNENDIRKIYYNKDESCLCVGFRDEDLVTNWVENATFEDIEWNYGTPQETQRKIQKELCKSCYYRDTISNKIKELEEENKTLKELNVCVGCDNNPDYKSRINKAIEYIENIEEDKEVDNLFINKKEKSFLVFYKLKNDLLKILKGEEK